MDPLSIASGIAGLITLAAKLVTILTDFTQNTRNAPNFAISLTSEVLSLRLIFEAIQKLVDDTTGELDESRLSMICINDLRLALMGCICVMGSLEKELLDGGVVIFNGRLTRETPETRSMAYAMPANASWDGRLAAKTGTFKAILDDMQRHKLTLNLMLGIIQCETSSEALRNAEALKESVDRVIQAQSITSRQLQILMAREGPPSEDMTQFETSSSIFSNVQSVLSIPIRSFETILKRTRVYRRDYVWNTSSLSLGSSVMKRTRWTTMSDLSLSDISNMAVINLPIWPQDVWNAEYYINQAPPIPILPEEEEGEAGPSNASIASTVPKIKGQRHLLYTIIDCNVEEVAEIVESGVSLDIDDGMGQGPLHWAVQTRCIEMARLLIDHGVDLNAGLPRFDTPPIHCAILVDDYDMTKLLIDHGCDLETVDSAGRTPLSFAASLDSVNIARLLLDSGANMKAKDKKHKMTPLHWAAECDAPKVAALLLERGASVWATDRNTKTPKMIAIMGRKKKVQEVFAAHSRSSKPKSIAP